MKDRLTIYEPVESGIPYIALKDGDTNLNIWQTDLQRLADHEDMGTLEELARRVEVVRCGECKHNIKGECQCFCYFDCEGQNHPVFHPDDDFYCSYGERKEVV